MVDDPAGTCRVEIHDRDAPPIGQFLHWFVHFLDIIASVLGVVYIRAAGDEIYVVIQVGIGIDGDDLNVLKLL